MTGACDGIGGCARFATQTVCTAPSCSGDRLNTAGTCNGLGSCRPPGMQNCAPYRCKDAACINRCASDTDCVTGIACQNGSCGKKTNGQPCAAAGDCASNHCVDGVCCDQACVGACRYCALPSTLGTCTPVANGGDDMRSMCQTQAPSTCGTDGKCDGAGACRRYKAGTVCAAEHCESNKYTPEATCSATGSCVAPDAIALRSLRLQRQQVLRQLHGGRATARPATCASPTRAGRSRTAPSARPGPSACRTPARRASAARPPARAPASRARCPARWARARMCPPAAPTRAQSCVDKRRRTCGTNGKCAAGACQLYGQGTPCAAASCPANTTTLTPASACDGAGACVTPPQSSCFPFKCGTLACKSTCTADADCATPNVCNNGSCGLQSARRQLRRRRRLPERVLHPGRLLHDRLQRKLHVVRAGRHAGHLQARPGRRHGPEGPVRRRRRGTCGTTGFCDGARQLPAVRGGHPVRGAHLSDVGDHRDAGAHLRRRRNLPPAGHAVLRRLRLQRHDLQRRLRRRRRLRARQRLQRAAPAASSGSASSAPAAPNAAAATAPTASAAPPPSCGNCQSCNVAGMAGMCNPVIAGDDGAARRLRRQPALRIHRPLRRQRRLRERPRRHQLRHRLVQRVDLHERRQLQRRRKPACSPRPAARLTPVARRRCRTMCGGDSDCASGFTCMSNVCTNLKANGAACTLGTECFSGNCTDGFCCMAASCGTCATCAFPGFQGTCHPVAAGGADPTGDCMMMPASTCGTTGTCDGAGHCATYPAGTTCADPDLFGGDADDVHLQRRRRVRADHDGLQRVTRAPSATACRTTCAARHRLRDAHTSATPRPAVREGSAPIPRRELRP